MKALELMGHTLLQAEVRPQGIFACNDPKKDQMSYIPLSDIRVAIESKPSDPNRFKAVNPQILEWSQHQETQNQEFRLLIDAKLKYQPIQLVRNNIG